MHAVTEYGNRTQIPSERQKM